MKQKASSFSEEKEAKRLLFVGVCATGLSASCKRTKVFSLLFLQKKKALLCF
jgi:hypothetical protein